MIKNSLKFGLNFNIQFEKYMFFIIPVFLILGFLFYPWLKGLTFLVPLLFAYITFVMALGCSWVQMKSALQMPLPIIVTLAIVHIAAPSLAYVLGVHFFGADSPYVIGMVLFAVLPLGVSTIIWVGITGGNVALVLSMVVLDSALSPFVVPFAISLFFGEAIEFNHLKVMEDLLLIIVVPTLFGLLLNNLTKGRIAQWSLPIGIPLSKFAFSGVILINAAVIAPHIIELKQDMLLIIPMIILLIALFYFIGFLGALPFRNREMLVTLTYSCGLRNNSLGVVIALGYFEPKAAVPVVLSILIQQPVATLIKVVMGRKKLVGENHLLNQAKGNHEGRMSL